MNTRFDSLLLLKPQDFLKWPTLWQRIVLCLFSILIIGLIYNQIATKNRIILLMQQQKITTLSVQLVKKQKIIQAAFNKNNINIQLKQPNLVSFLKNISEIAQKNHIQIQVIKPYTNQHTANNDYLISKSLQILVMGDYLDLLTFMRETEKLSLFIHIMDFKMTTTLTHLIQLTTIINLY